MLRIKAPLLLLGKASIKKNYLLRTSQFWNPPPRMAKNVYADFWKKYIFFYIVHFIKPYRDQCICKLDLGKVLWNGLYAYQKIQICPKQKTGPNELISQSFSSKYIFFRFWLRTCSIPAPPPHLRTGPWLIVFLTPSLKDVVCRS